MRHLSLIASKQATAFVFRTAQLSIFCHAEEANIEFGHLSREKWPTKNLSFSREKSIFLPFCGIRSDLMTGAGLKPKILRSP
jgi:hypothetical protein